MVKASLASVEPDSMMGCVPRMPQGSRRLYHRVHGTHLVVWVAKEDKSGIQTRSSALSSSSLNLKHSRCFSVFRRLIEATFTQWPAARAPKRHSITPDLPLFSQHHWQQKAA
eukprot:1239161-Rhodomonas_salina.2